MRFRMSIIAIVFAICMMLSGCTWVTSGDIWHIKFFPVEDYEVRRLVEVFGDEVMDHVDSGRLTDDEYQALMAYQAGQLYQCRGSVSHNGKCGKRSTQRRLCGQGR